MRHTPSDEVRGREMRPRQSNCSGMQIAYEPRVDRTPMVSYRFGEDLYWSRRGSRGSYLGGAGVIPEASSRRHTRSDEGAKNLSQTRRASLESSTTPRQTEGKQFA